MICSYLHLAGFLPGIFVQEEGEEPIALQISFVMLFFLLFLDQIAGGSLGRKPVGMTSF